MKWKNVRLIFTREMRDQLRDRRTLFLIAVLPLLLYPLLGMSFFQVSQFLRNTAAKVLVVGDEELAKHEWLPPLLGEEKFHASLFLRNPLERDNLLLVTSESLANNEDPQSHSNALEPLEAGSAALASGEVQVVIYFPPGFGDRLQTARESLIQRIAGETSEETELPEPQIYFNSANEKSRVAQLRVERALRNWRTSVMQTNLRDSNVPLEAARPFDLQPQDVAEEQQKHAVLWSKVLPFILFIWALTGAFYPAVDLCAGEKERGTLETLLASPAQRREIVWGKLLTVMTFSVVTALLNLGSMGITGKFVLAQFREITAQSEQGFLSMPPLVSVVWLTVALLPVAALFSALCLACAAFARSTKEGQYYLMPLLLVIMPLMFLPMSPGVELNLGNSLIPMTGVVLLLRSMIEGQYWQALPFVVPVVGVTLICCLLAIRWAEEQFHSESVLFRESERLDLRHWLVHLVRDRLETPTFAQGILCSGLILVLIFFMNVAFATMVAGNVDFHFFFQTTFILQVVCIAMPAVLMTLLFASRRRKTLLLDHWPRWQLLLAAGLLALFMRPLGLSLAAGIEQLYPVSVEMKAQLEGMNELVRSAPNVWWIILLMALLPAVCEEVAFRGFVLSGLRHVGHKWWAIGLSSVAFGLVHPILQQQIAAAAVGMVLGYLAVQTGSLLVCIVFHAIYNGLALAIAEFSGNLYDAPWKAWIFQGEAEFRPWVLALSAVAAIAILWWLHRLPYQRSKEERLQEARERQFAGT
ncbi:MAG: ABC transporter permease [Pirellulales bacterium]|nr:ABC transporter permease [Pirellulales bacterium]